MSNTKDSKANSFSSSLDLQKPKFYSNKYITYPFIVFQVFNYDKNFSIWVMLTVFYLCESKQNELHEYIFHL